MDIIAALTLQTHPYCPDDSDYFRLAHIPAIWTGPSEQLPALVPLWQQALTQIGHGDPELDQEYPPPAIYALVVYSADATDPEQALGELAGEVPAGIQDLILRGWGHRYSAPPSVLRRNLAESGSAV